MHKDGSHCGTLQGLRAALTFAVLYFNHPLELMRRFGCIKTVTIHSNLECFAQLQIYLPLWLLI